VALKSELMAAGMPAAQANRLGWDPPTVFTPATGGQTGGATLLTANHAIVEPTAGSQGVLLADAQQMYFIYNSGAVSSQTITVYPPLGASFTGKTANTGLTVATTVTVWIEPGGPSGIPWSLGTGQ